ncbi:hypothetical protein sS8_3577 [Methylocaldum marinum]|jgi:hypothetical protein|uniref:Uncharacterized protein n=1 Tax=Methylocaldum marinum TaxID=1432792 RepID=A0A250KVI5_9GAMM|nr:hypothetical protein sS8_3577 [Methylocaldum marinum]
MHIPKLDNGLLYHLNFPDRVVKNSEGQTATRYRNKEALLDFASSDAYLSPC